MDQGIFEWIINFKPDKGSSQGFINIATNEANEGCGPQLDIGATAGYTCEARQDSSSELMDIVLLLQLCLACAFLRIKGVHVLGVHEDVTAGSRRRNNRIHYHMVGFHQIVGDFGRTSIHEHRCDEDQQCPGK
jgi:hypothetical protein